MRRQCRLILISLAIASAPLVAQESMPTGPQSQQADQEDERQGEAWTKKLTSREERGSLHNAAQNVRGDSGKWNDEPILQHAPPFTQKPANVSLDDWADALLERPFQVHRQDDNWLLFRSRQLDDNDRVWVQQIERSGNQFTVTVEEAIWQGRYFKTFTYYSALGVNLGKLEPGKYEAIWIIKPLAFKQFEGDGRPTDNWPKDERTLDEKPTELHIKFTVDDDSSDE
jgi:hypothetical protein